MKAALISIALLLVVAILGITVYPIAMKIGTILSQEYTDQTEEAIAAREAGEAFATQLSDEGIVLLKNEGDLLPLVTKNINFFVDKRK